MVKLYTTGIFFFTLGYAGSNWNSLSGLLDLTHLGYLHASTIGTNDDAATPEVRDVDARRLSSRRHMQDTPPAPLITRRFGVTENVDRLSGMDFFFPGFHAGISETRLRSDGTAPGREVVSSRVWHAVTPAQRTSTNYFFAMGSKDRQGIEDLVDLLRPVIAEDAFATEQIEKMMDGAGAPARWLRPSQSRANLRTGVSAPTLTPVRDTRNTTAPPDGDGSPVFSINSLLQERLMHSRVGDSRG
jgi:hypothetical protein